MARRYQRTVWSNTLLIFKSQQYRRTQLRLRPPRSSVTRGQSHSSGSFFHRLPVEVIEMILEKLSALEISVFSMVSKDITRYVVDFISTVAWKNKMIIQNLHKSSCLERSAIIQHFRDLGLLFKRCTLLLPTKERLKFIFSRFSQIPCFRLEQCLAQVCSDFSCYGVFLQTLIAGWDEPECHRVFSFLCEYTNLMKKMEAVVSEEPGVCWYGELQLRLFCRQVLLDPCTNNPECQFWLMQLLKTWPLVSQAHILFIFYGPLLPEGTLGWQDLVERGVPQDSLLGLARAVLLLFSKLEEDRHTSSSWLAILEELIVIPQPWHVENVARLLVLCGSDLCYTVLASKVVNGQLLEISRLLVYIILVCEKDGYHMSWAVKLVQQLYKVFSTAPEKLYFIQHLENMFSEVVMEFFQFALAGNRLEDREVLQTLCLLLDSRAHFHTKFLHMLL